MIAVPSRAPLGSWRLLSTGVLIGAAAIFMLGLLAAGGSERLGYDFRAAYLPTAESVHDTGWPAVTLVIAHPRFSAVWVLPIVLWVSSRAGNRDGIETIVPAIVAAILLAALLTRPRTEGAVVEAPA